MQETAFDRAGVVAFLNLLLQEIDGKLLLIWDGAPIQRRQTIQPYLPAGAARIWLARLPAHAPDRKPDEGIWHYLKHGARKNTCCADWADLRQTLATATVSLRHKPEISKACFAQVGYY